MFCFKRKTAYEVRISDWSSDVVLFRSLNGATIGRNCLIGAGALVTEGKTIPDNSLVLGAPAKIARDLSETEIAGLKRAADHYVENARRFSSGLRPVP